MPYPETRAYKAIGRSVCRDVRTLGQLVLIVHEQRLFGSRRGNRLPVFRSL